MKGFGATLVAGWVLTLAAGVGLGYLAFRPETESPGETYLHRLQREYDLTDQQVRAIRGHLDEEDRAIQAILDRLDGQVRQEIQSARRAAEESIRAALTEEQRNKFDRDRAGH